MCIIKLQTDPIHFSHVEKLQARRKHFGSGAATGTKKTAGGQLREFGHFKALKLALLQQFRQDFYYKNLKAERHILKD